MASHPLRFALLVAAAVAAPALAQPAGTPKPVRPPVTEPEPIRNEPVVQHIVIEDDGTRIEELHVRGEAQRITVQPKGLDPRFKYEVIPASGARDLAPGPGSTRGAAGQRVWNILNF